MESNEIEHDPKDWHCKCNRCVRLGEQIDRDNADRDRMDKTYRELLGYGDQYDIAEWCEMNNYTPSEEWYDDID